MRPSWYRSRWLWIPLLAVFSLGLAAYRYTSLTPIYEPPAPPAPTGAGWELLSRSGPKAHTPRHHSPGALLVSNAQEVRVPSEALDGGTAWLNTAGPIHLDELRGKVVLLDFWTYCCINCHHILPDLAKLEKKYANELVVIGVHTPKFPAEQDTENIRKKVVEYRIKHPVINDANQTIWNNFGVNSWPTLVLIDARGVYRGRISGEGHYEVLDNAIGELVAQHRRRGELNETPLHFGTESDRPHDQPLSFPGKVLADGPGKRLFISDTGHNRIVITGLDGTLIDAIGSGLAGRKDGAYAEASFNRPQGLCRVGDTLYVADTENHMIRAIDLESKQVRTVAGTGEQSYRRAGEGPARSTGLNSPWDIIQIPGTSRLVLAMAGSHQLWILDLEQDVVEVWAGSGLENIIDGGLDSAAFAQPSGLATDGKFIYVADSEVSGIRAVSLERDRTPRVRTIVGVDLFGFGDVDGRGDQVRLQHCLGLEYRDGKLFVADTYNNKIKVCEPGSRTVRTLLGSRESGRTDSPATFDEPGGLSMTGSVLYVADTNNHAIRAVDLKDPRQPRVRTLALEGVEPPSPPRQPPKFLNSVVMNAPDAEVVPGDQFTIKVELKVPEGYKINPEASMPYLLEAPGEPGLLSESVPTAGSRLDEPSDRFTVTVPLANPASAGDRLALKLSVSAFFCKEDSGFCEVKSYIWNVPVSFNEGAGDQIALTNVMPRGESAEEPPAESR